MSLASCGLFSFSEGLAGVSEEKLSGYIDRSGQWVLQEDISLPTQFKFGLAAVIRRKEVHYVTREGKSVF